MKRIKKGDTVEIIAGDDKGARGTVLRVLSKAGRVVVSGVNLVTKHESGQQAGRSQMQGGRIQFEAPVAVSNVMLIDPETDKPTRVRMEEVNGRMVRVAVGSGSVIDRRRG